MHTIFFSQLLEVIYVSESPIYISEMYVHKNV